MGLSWVSDTIMDVFISVCVFHGQDIKMQPRMERGTGYGGLVVTSLCFY